MGMCNSKEFILAVLVINRVSILAISVSKRVPLYGFCTLVLNLVCLLEGATFSSSIRPSIKALHNAFNIGLN